MHLKFRNVNEAFLSMVKGFHEGTILTDVLPSRDGEVIKVNEPCLITYEYPRERVLFNSARDANPFFHLFESLWMLAGRDDLAPLLYYNSKMARFTDNGVTQPDAYGKRWRSYFGYDQLEHIAHQLSENPNDRRVVLSMWDPMGVAECLDSDPDRAVAKSAGVPCNTQAFFDIEEGNILNMTVCNRSNDMIRGMFGANVVHFSLLHEYMADRIGAEVGRYHQFTNNLHAYTGEGWTPKKWIQAAYWKGSMHDPIPHEYGRSGVKTATHLLHDTITFDNEVKEFIDSPFQLWKEPFLETVAKPMCIAFREHKDRRYDKAYEALGKVQATDWFEAGRQWIEKREKGWSAKREESKSETGANDPS